MTIVPCIRSNIFLPIADEDFLKQESKSLGIKKGEMISKALKAWKREKVRRSMNAYYQDDANRAFEKKFTEEYFIINEDV